MNVQQSYAQWAEQYDTNINRTRDLEANALMNILATVSFDNILEIGCGTGKNTVWLAERAKHLTSVDLSEEMLTKARAKINSGHVDFVQADITAPWLFIHKTYDLVSFSLVLEHIEQLDDIFQKAAAALKPGGHIYIGELHPFKQYTGSKARFETETGTHIVQCFNHHISDFINLGNQHGLELKVLEEYFDKDDRNGVPRLLVLLLRKR